MAHGAARYGSNDVANAIVKGEPINVFNRGQMVRDFTYIDDIVGS